MYDMVGSVRRKERSHDFFREEGRKCKHVSVCEKRGQGRPKPLPDLRSKHNAEKAVCLREGVKCRLENVCEMRVHIVVAVSVQYE
jgi:hypothetical protein